MTTIVVLFAVGILLLAAEVIVPGGILGIAGALAVVGGVVVSFQELGMDGGLIATLVASVIGAAMLYWEFVLLPRSKFIKHLSVEATVAGRSQPALARREEIVGQEGVVVTDLTPSGYVNIGGKRYEASCQTGRLEEGTPVRVVGVDTFKLIVTEIKT